MTGVVGWPRTGCAGVVIADTQPLFRLGAWAAAGQSARLEPVAQVSDAEGLIGAINRTLAQVAVVGTNVPTTPSAGRVTGLGATMAVRRLFPAVAVVVVSERPTESELFDALRFGTAAYLGRAIEIPILSDVLVQVANGAFVFDAAVLTRRVQTSTPPVPMPANATLGRGEGDANDGVSTLELEILSLIGQGRSNRAIGATLQISDQTVKNHVTALLRKLGVSDRTRAVVEAIRLGIMRP